MAVDVTAITPSSGGGSQSFTGLSFLPTWAVFVIAGKSASDSQGHMSLGFAKNNGGTITQVVRSTFTDTAGPKSSYSNSKCFNHMERVSGTINAVMDGTLTSFDNPVAGVYGFTLNFTNSSTYPIAVLYGN